VLGQDVEIQIAPVSPHTVRLGVLPVKDGKAVAVAGNGTLVRESWGAPAATFRGPARSRKVKLGSLAIQFTPDPLAFTITNAEGSRIQRIKIDKDTGVVSFDTGAAPILGLGEGGPQFDRRGYTERMSSGSSGYNLRTFGSRVPIPWLIGTAGWALYIHQPFGRFDFTGDESKFLPASAHPPAGGRGAPPPPAPAQS
jgi:alpha-glucosidase/alpha-D-xyloside xylohydrolase